MTAIFVVVHFIKDNTYTICEDSKNKLTIYKDFQFNYPKNGKDVWYTGTVVYKGLKASCEKAAESLMAGIEYICDSYTESSADESCVEKKKKIFRRNFKWYVFTIILYLYTN